MNRPKPPRPDVDPLKEKDGSSEEVTALARGLTVLRAVAAADAPLSNRELTELTGIPKPTVSRITATLVGAGFLFRLPDSERFVLTSSVLELSNGFLRNFDIRARSRPFLIALPNAPRVRASGGARPARHGRHRRDRSAFRGAGVAPRNRLLRIESEPHRHRPRLSRGARRAEREELLIGLQAAEGDDWGRGSRLDAALEDTIERGYAIATGEWHNGMNAIALGFTGPSASAMRSIAVAPPPSVRATG